MTAFRVSRAAATDIRQIARFTQDQWGADQRRRYLTGLNHEFEVLSRNPEMAPERREFTPPVRIRRYGRHIVVYVIEGDAILIVRVLHQSMDMDAHLPGH